MANRQAASLTPEQLLEDLASDDEAVVVRALHAACPCTGSDDFYARFTPILNEMKKDPRPKVRAVALHLQEDALSQLQLDDERANGFDRNRPGGYGKRRTPKRSDQRHGFAPVANSRRQPR